MSENFYKKIAPEYDRMTSFSSRIEQEIQTLQPLVQDLNITTALDAGCGTGITAIALARCGVNTIAIDNSREMLDIAENNSRPQNNVTWYLDDLEKIKYNIRNLDAIFCTGNVLPHILSPASLRKTCCEFKKCIRQNGYLFLQLLNYDRVLLHGEKLVGVNKNGNHEFIRFYEMNGKYLFFNILHITWADNKATTEWNTTQLYPYTKTELEQILNSAGFKIDGIYADFKFSQWQKTSKDLVIIARPSD